MHSEHNTKMSLTNICGNCLAYIGTSHQDFTWKQLFVSGIAFAVQSTGASFCAGSLLKDSVKSVAMNAQLYLSRI